MDRALPPLFSALLPSSDLSQRLLLLDRVYFLL